MSSPENYASKDLLSKAQEFEQAMGYSEEIPFKAFNLETMHDDDTGQGLQDSPESVEKLVCTDFTQAEIEVINSDSSAVRVWLEFNKHSSQKFWGPQV